MANLNLQFSNKRYAFDPQVHYWGTACIRGHTNSDGKTWRHRDHRYCVLCNREKSSQWNKNHKERVRQSEARRSGNRVRKDRRKIYPITCYLGDVRRRAKESGILCTLTPDDLKKLWIKQGGKCAWTSQELDFMRGGARHPFRPSLDRIEPKKGYVPDNVVWSSNFANRARGDLPADEFRSLVKELGLTPL